MNNHDELKRAHAAGKRIQYQTGSIVGHTNGAWETVDNPIFEPSGQYRIHPDDASTEMHIHRDAIIAWANGKIIEYCLPNSNVWRVCDYPTWFHDTKYRVKKDSISYRVALMKHYIHDKMYTEITDSTRVRDLEGDVFFVKWLTEEIEVEI